MVPEVPTFFFCTGRGGHGGAVLRLSGPANHAARAVSERQQGPSMNVERWGALAGHQALFVGGWGGWRCAPARRPRRQDELLDGDGRPRGGAAAAACHGESNPEPLVADVPPEGPSRQVIHGRRRAGRAPQRRCPSSRACHRARSPPSMQDARAPWSAPCR